MNKQTIKSDTNHNDDKTSDLFSVKNSTMTEKSTKAKHPAVHHTKTSQTLMRSAVKKPIIVVAEKKIRVQPEVRVSEPKHRISQKVSVTSVNHGRSERAQTMLRSDKISRFFQSDTPSVPTRYEHIPVQLAPQTTPNNGSVLVPQPRPTNERANTDIFSQAIAASHHYVDVRAYGASYRKRVKVHFVSMAAGLMAVIIMSGLGIYLSTPGFQIQVAGIRAGIHSSVPDYTKAGFAFAGVNVQDGKRVIYLKDSLGEQYQLTEQTTNWSEQSMVRTTASHKANGAPNYRVRPIDGLNVYHFDSGAVSWVKDGTWYNLGGTSTPTDSQLQLLLQNG